MPGFAMFGDAPVYIMGEYENRVVDYRSIVEYTPLLANPRNPGAFYLLVQGISVSWSSRNTVLVPASLPRSAFDVDARTGRGGVGHALHHHAARRVPSVRPGVRGGHK